MDIRIAEASDISNYFEHLERHGQEVTSDSVISAPFEEAPKVPYANFVEEKSESWTLPTSAIGWERCFILIGPKPNLIVGGLTVVHRPPLKSSLHRALLMLGIERSYRGKGYGKELLAKAIHWAKTETVIEWFELIVFENNIAAKKLYEDFGFVEVGRSVDKFRIRGQKINDIEMALNLTA